MATGNFTKIWAPSNNFLRISTAGPGVFRRQYTSFWWLHLSLVCDMKYVITLQHRRFLMTVSINGSFLKITVLKIGTLCLQRTYNFIHSEAVVERCSVKKVFLKISQNSQENTGARASFLIKLQAWASKWLLLLIFNLIYVPRILLTFSKKSFQNF